MFDKFSNWSNKHPVAFAVVLIVLVASAAVGVVAAAGYLMTSKQVTITVAEQATLALTVSQTNIVVGDTVTVTVTCSDSTFNGAVEIKANDVIIATPTATAGTAHYNWKVMDAGIYTLQATATHT